MSSELEGASDLEAVKKDLSDVIRLLRTRFGELNRDFSVLKMDVDAPKSVSAEEKAEKRIREAREAMEKALGAL